MSELAQRVALTLVVLGELDEQEIGVRFAARAALALLDQLLEAGDRLLTLAEFAQDRLEQGDESFGSAAVVDVRVHRG